MASTAQQQQTPESTVWTGRPSQWVNVLWFAACIVVIPIPVAIYKWLEVKCTRFTITNQRFRIERGILTRHFDDLELYRVKDITLTQPLTQRLVGLGTLTMITSDATTPTLVLPAVKDPRGVQEVLRREVERMRRERGVRELDVHDENFV